MPSAPGPTRRRSVVAVIGAGLVAAALFLVITALLMDRPLATPSASATPGVIAGEPGGEVVVDTPPSPTGQPTSSAAPTPAPTEPPATVAPTVEPTPAPLAAATAAPQPTADVPAPTASPGPQGITLAAAGPDDAVLAFYRHAESGRFDEAYALWSERMKSLYPRSENLDQRFDDTASITFSQLSVAEQAGSAATVQANFTEVYDGGASREFIGYWRLIRTSAGWLLHEPHY